MKYEIGQKVREIKTGLVYEIYAFTTCMNELYLCVRDPSFYSDSQFGRYCLHEKAYEPA